MVVPYGRTMNLSISQISTIPRLFSGPPPTQDGLEQSRLTVRYTGSYGRSLLGVENHFAEASNRLIKNHTPLAARRGGESYYCGNSFLCRESR